MKKKIVILGSTGSIGKTTFNIIKKNPKDFEIVLLTTNKNITKIIQQAKLLKVKNILISSPSHYLKIKKELKNSNIRVHNNIDNLQKIINKKIDYTMCAISGLSGLKPTIDSIKFSKTIAIANKESIICGWPFINKALKKYKTKFIPVDSEHFSIWSLIKNSPQDSIDKIIITASGGPFLNKSHSLLKKIKPSDAIKHPNWKMGKKISIDSATLMNKIFEVIEAKKIFKISYDKLAIIIHPKSYVHAIIKFKNGLTKIIVHDTDMKIPIFNSLYSSKKFVNSKKLDSKALNNLDFRGTNSKKFPLIKVLKMLPENTSLFETILVSINDKFVELFLRNKIKFTDISKKMNKMLNLYSIKKYKKIKPKNIEEIVKMNTKIKNDIENLIKK